MFSSSIYSGWIPEDSRRNSEAAMGNGVQNFQGMAFTFIFTEEKGFPLSERIRGVRGHECRVSLLGSIFSTFERVGSHGGPLWKTRFLEGFPTGVSPPPPRWFVDHRGFTPQGV